MPASAEIHEVSPHQGRELIDLDALIATANDIAPLPATTVRLASLISSQQYDVADVADIIAFDPAIMLHVLRCANSAASATAVPVTTARDAVLRLGSGRILALAVASHTRPLLRDPLPEYRLAQGALWRHSVAAALVAETAPAYCSIAVPTESFTAALLHDIGKLVLARFLDPFILGLLKRASQHGGLSEMEAERQLLEVHHAELGGLIAQHWRLPDRIIKGITYHHEPAKGNDSICDIVHMADGIAKTIEQNLAGGTELPNLTPEVMDRLIMKSSQMKALCCECLNRFAQVSARYSAS